MARGRGTTPPPPPSGGDLLLVVTDVGSPTAQELARQSMIESWGYTVTRIAASDSQASFDAAVTGVDVAYVSDEVTAADLGTKLKEAAVGVVNEQVLLTDEFGFSTSQSFLVDQSKVTISDDTHYITLTFGTGPLTIFDTDQPTTGLADQNAPDLQQLGTSEDVLLNQIPSLVVLEAGGLLAGGGTAAGRRVELPWGGAAVDINALTADGQSLMERAIGWAASAASAAGVLGYDTEFSTPVTNVQKTQIATQATLPVDGTVTGIQAYVDTGPRKARFAIYTDAGGEPGTLVVETNKASGGAGASWLSLPVTPTALTAGTYWIALAFNRDDQSYFQQSGGETRYLNHNAETNGFLPSWGTSDDSYSITVSIYATYVPD